MQQNKTNIMEETTREKLIVAIYDSSSDELTEDDWFKIAQESESQLLDRVINILYWYKNAYNETI
jgi:hypothetical protein